MVSSGAAAAYNVYVVSKGRPQNVAKMNRWLDGPLQQVTTWLIDEDDEKPYVREGGMSFYKAAKWSLAAKRNYGLWHARQVDKVCVQLDDDLAGLRITHDFKTSRKCTLKEALDFLVSTLCGYGRGINLAGVNLGDNLRFAKPVYPLHLPLPGGLFAVRPNSPLEFDTTLLCMEDIDYAFQHIVTHGGALRVTNILPRFGGTKKAAGGCQTYRTPQTEYDAAQYLQTKWNDHQYAMNAQFRKFFEFKTDNTIQRRWLEEHGWQS